MTEEQLAYIAKCEKFIDEVFECHKLNVIVYGGYYRDKTIIESGTDKTLKPSDIDIFITFNGRIGRDDDMSFMIRKITSKFTFSDIQLVSGVYGNRCYKTTVSDDSGFSIDLDISIKEEGETLYRDMRPDYYCNCICRSMADGIHVVHNYQHNLESVKEMCINRCAVPYSFSTPKYRMEKMLSKGFKIMKFSQN